MSNVSIKSSVLRYFTATSCESGKWICVCGKILTQKKATGWTNLFNHLKSQHPDWLQEENKPTMDNFFDVVPTKESLVPTTLAENVHSWLEWVCLGLKPFSFVTDPLTWKYTNLYPIPLNTLKKCMDLVVCHVEEKISALLPDKFALVLDGWPSKSSPHYLAVFASFPANNSLGFSTLLLAFSPFLVETELSASAHKDFLDCMLANVYSKSMTNVVAIIADNSEVYKALSEQCGKPFIGCASHRFNLAVMKLMDPYKEILNKLNGLMEKVKTLKPCEELRKLTDLHPVQHNTTRWSFTETTVHRYFELKPHLTYFDCHQSELIDYMPSARENSELIELDRVLQQLASVTKALQRENLDLADVRMLFDEVVSIHSETVPYLGPDCNIVMCKHFENAITKILDHTESTLTAEETEAVASLKLDVVVQTESKLDFASAVLKRRKVESSQYMDCKFILPTSNMCERFFSAVGYCISDDHHNLHPLNLEKQLFLKLNKTFWDDKEIAKVVANTQ